MKLSMSLIKWYSNPKSSTLSMNAFCSMLCRPVLLFSSMNNTLFGSTTIKSETPANAPRLAKYCLLRYVASLGQLKHKYCGYCNRNHFTQPCCKLYSSPCFKVYHIYPNYSTPNECTGSTLRFCTYRTLQPFCVPNRSKLFR